MSKKCTFVVSGEKVDYTLFSGSIKPEDDLGSVGDIYQLDTDTLYYREKSGWLEGKESETRHPIYGKLAFLSFSRNKGCWILAGTLRSRKAKGNATRKYEESENTPSAFLKRSRSEESEHTPPVVSKRSRSEASVQGGASSTIRGTDLDENESAVRVPPGVLPENEWIADLRDEWNRVPLSCLPRAKDGLLLLNALAEYPSPIPLYDQAVPFDKVCKGQKPTLSHVMQDLLLVDEDKLSITDAGQRHVSEGGITKAQLLACLIQMPSIREYSSTTRLYSALDLHFQKGGSHLCGLVIPAEISKCALVDQDETGLCWGTSLCSAGMLTDIHYDYHGPAQLMVGISTRKLWLIWPPTHNNLEWWSGFRARTPTGVETLDAVKHMEGLTLLYQRGINAFILPPYHLHAVLTFKTSAHCGVTFWNLQSWKDFSQYGLEWEYSCMKDYLSKGYGLRDAQVLSQDVLDALERLDVFALKFAKKDKDLRRWIVDLRKRVLDLKLGQID